MKIKAIPGYEGLYFADTEGNIYSSGGIGGRINKLNPASFKGWYHQLRLCKDGRQKPLRVHRLVALTFLSNPDNKRCVNHKNGIKPIIELITWNG